MAGSYLATALSQIKWDRNVQEFCQDTNIVARFEACNARLAVWSKEFEDADRENAALPFTREMQASGHTVPALTALAMYKPAASALRTVVESALYYSYFRTHPSEIATLVRVPDYHVSKTEIIAYHSMHTVGFKDLQTRLGLVSDLTKWYSVTSAIIHGQVPGTWSSHVSLKQVSHKANMIETVGESFEACVRLVHYLFLCTVGRELWNDFGTSGKRALLKGLPGDVKSALQLDSA